MVPCVCVCVCVSVCACVHVLVGGVYSRVPATVSASQKACRFSRPIIKTLDELISPQCFLSITLKTSEMYVLLMFSDVFRGGDKKQDYVLSSKYTHHNNAE